jgi:hypothetical protein
LVGQQRIVGASTRHAVDGHVVQAARGSVWVSLLPNYDWRQVSVSDVTISLKGASAMQTVSDIGKRRGRRAKNLGAGDVEPTEDSTVVDQEPTGQKRLDGMERVADQEIEDLAWGVHDLQTKRMKAGEKEKGERQKLTDIMVAKGVDNYPLDDEMEVVLKKSQKAYVRKKRKTEPDDD